MDRAEAVGPVARPRQRRERAAILWIVRVHLHGGLHIALGLVHPAPLIAHGPLQEVPLPVVIRLGVEQLLRQVQVSLRDSQPDPLPRSAVSAAVIFFFKSLYPFTAAAFTSPLR